MAVTSTRGAMPSGDFTSSMRRKAARNGFTVVGFVRVGGEEPQIHGERIINLRQPLAEYARQTEIDQIVIALDDKSGNLPMDELFQCRMNGVQVLDLVNFFEREAGKILVDRWQVSIVQPGITYCNHLSLAA